MLCCIPHSWQTTLIYTVLLVTQGLLAYVYASVSACACTCAFYMVLSDLRPVCLSYAWLMWHVKPMVGSESSKWWEGIKSSPAVTVIIAYLILVASVIVGTRVTDWMTYCVKHYSLTHGYSKYTPLCKARRPLLVGLVSQSPADGKQLVSGTSL